MSITCQYVDADGDSQFTEIYAGLTKGAMVPAVTICQQPKLLVIIPTYRNESQPIPPVAAPVPDIIPEPEPVLDLLSHMHSQVDDRLGLDPEAEKPLWSVLDNNTPNYVRSPECWLDDVNFTSHCVWQSRGVPGQRCATAITPDIFMANLHSDWWNEVGDTFRFVGSDGSIHTRTMTARLQVANTDLYLGRLDSDLPSSVTPAKVLPANFENYTEPEYTYEYYGAPMVSLDQEDHVTVRNIFRFNGNVTGLNVWWNAPSISQTNGAQRLLYYEETIGGDSSDPQFMIINNEAILMATIHGTSWAPAVHTLLTEISAAMVSLGSTHILTVVDLSEFKTY